MYYVQGLQDALRKDKLPRCDEVLSEHEGCPTHRQPQP